MKFPGRVAAVCVALFIAASATAEEREKSGRFELTPFAGLGFGGEFDAVDQATGDPELDDAGVFGLIFNAQAAHNTQYEVIYSRQSTELDTSAVVVDEPLLDIDVHYLQIGGTYVFEGEFAQAYVALTAGLAHFDPPADFDSETFFSGSLGVGARIFPYERFGIRVEGRVFGTLADGDSDVFCRTGPDNNVCAVGAEGDIVGQWLLFAGATLRF